MKLSPDLLRKKRSVKDQISRVKQTLKPEAEVWDSFIEMTALIEKFYNYLEKKEKETGCG